MARARNSWRLEESTYGRVLARVPRTIILVALIAAMPPSSFADAVKDCEQKMDLKQQVKGCTELLNRSLTPELRSLVYRNRGSAYEDLGQYDAAIADLNQSIAINADALAYAIRGVAFEMKQRYDLAITDFNAAIQLRPDVAEFYLARGNGRLAKGDTAGAIADFNVVVEKKPNLPDGYYMRARANELLNQNDVAIADLSHLMNLDSGWKAVALFFRALANEAKGRYDLAEPDFVSAIALDARWAMERHWVEYLKSIQADGDYPNWSGKPYDLYLRTSGLH